MTLLIEVPLYAAFLRGTLRVHVRTAAVAGAVVNLSHPLAMLVAMPLLMRWIAWGAALAIVEGVVWAVEAAALALWFRRDLPLIVTIAFVANAASFVLGSLVLR